MSETPAYIEDTIVAAATPPGKGGIGIVRISGPATEEIARRVLGGLPKARFATTTKFRAADGAAIDTGIALYFPAPDSFTGESVLELQGHGGPVVMSLLIDAVVEMGARRAQPGEFSKRAFLNGKLDLVQAEAVADLIDSGTARGARAALRSLAGTFSKAVEELQEQLTRLRLHVEAAIDFPEEEIDFLDDVNLHKQIEKCAAALASLQNQTRIGSVLRDGFRIVIVGKPNAGKSSLLNALSGQDAAIVTEVAGTTRDILRESIDIDGLMVELVDTAGLRDDPDMIEAEGIRRARAALKNADAILWIQDAHFVDTGRAPADGDRPRRRCRRRYSADHST
jgi:tRNA modification GTPase